MDLIAKKSICSYFLIGAILYLRVNAQAGRKNGNNGVQFNPSLINPTRGRETCARGTRSLTGVCNNLRRPFWGAARQPHFTFNTYHKPLRVKGLPSPRFVSNVLCKQERGLDIFNNRRMSEFVVFFGQFVDHTIVSTPTTEKSMPIPIPEGDIIFYNFSRHELPFQKSRTIDGVPINSLSSFIDLATIYSSNDKRLRSLRRFENGSLRNTMPGDLLPLNEDEMVNAPSKSKRFFLSGDHRSNEHPILTSIHILFFREHNRLCLELQKDFPTWSDARLFETARKINIAQFQKIVFEEWYPKLTGRKLPRYVGYNPWMNPTISNIFATAAFRIGHTMIGDQITRIDSGKVGIKPMKVNRMFFNSYDDSPLRRHGIEPFIRGALFTRAQEVDTLVVPALRNFLFRNVKEETGFDLVALNIQRGRDHRLPSYNSIRDMFGIPKARDFKDITRNLDMQSRLHTVYGTVDKVEAWIGLVAEDHAKKSSLGPTTLKIFEAEFLRLRDGDRFYFRRWWLFPEDNDTKISRIRKMRRESSTMRHILRENTGLRKSEIAKIWKV